MILELKNSMLTSLPDNFKYNDTVDCSWSDIEQLPEKFFIKGDLILNNSKINYIPAGTVISGNVYTNKPIVIHKDALIQGFVQEEDKQYFHDAPNHVIYTDAGQRIVFKSRQKHKQKLDPLIEWFYPALFFYKSINGKDYAVQYSEKEKTFCLYCNSVEDGERKVNWHRAEVRGINEFKDYDIYEERSVGDLINIYKICTGCCETGPNNFISKINVDKEKKYSINFLREALIKTNILHIGQHVFMDFFDPEKKNKESL